MASKKIEISGESIKKAWADFQKKANEFLAKAQAWLKDYFSRIDTYGIIAVSTIGLGFLMFIIGIIIL